MSVIAPRTIPRQLDSIESKPYRWLHADPDYWQHRADDCRAAAAEMASDPEALHILGRLVGYHEHMQFLTWCQKWRMLQRW